MRIYFTFIRHLLFVLLLSVFVLCRCHLVVLISCVNLTYRSDVMHNISYDILTTRVALYVSYRSVSLRGRWGNDFFLCAEEQKWFFGGLQTLLSHPKFRGDAFPHFPLPAILLFSLQLSCKPWYYLMHHLKSYMIHQRVSFKQIFLSFLISSHCYGKSIHVRRYLVGQVACFHNRQIFIMDGFAIN